MNRISDDSTEAASPAAAAAPAAGAATVVVVRCECKSIINSYRLHNSTLCIHKASALVCLLCVCVCARVRVAIAPVPRLHILKENTTYIHPLTCHIKRINDNWFRASCSKPHTHVPFIAEPRGGAQTRRGIIHSITEDDIYTRHVPGSMLRFDIAVLNALIQVSSCSSCIAYTFFRITHDGITFVIVCMHIHTYIRTQRVNHVLDLDFNHNAVHTSPKITDNISWVF